MSFNRKIAGCIEQKNVDLVVYLTHRFSDNRIKIRAAAVFGDCPFCLRPVLPHASFSRDRSAKHITMS